METPPRRFREKICKGKALHDPGVCRCRTGCHCKVLPRHCRFSECLHTGSKCIASGDRKQEQQTEDECAHEPLMSERRKSCNHAPLKDVQHSVSGGYRSRKQGGNGRSRRPLTVLLQEPVPGDLEQHRICIGNLKFGKRGVAIGSQIEAAFAIGEVRDGVRCRPCARRRCRWLPGP